MLVFWIFRNISQFFIYSASDAPEDIPMNNPPSGGSFVKENASSLLL